MTDMEPSTVASPRDLVIGYTVATLMVSALTLLLSLSTDAPDAGFLRHFWIILVSKLGYMHGLASRKLTLAILSVFFAQPHSRY